MPSPRRVTAGSALACWPRTEQLVGGGHPSRLARSRSTFSPVRKAGTHHEQHQHHRRGNHGPRPGHRRAPADGTRHHRRSTTTGPLSGYDTEPSDEVVGLLNDPAVGGEQADQPLFTGDDHPHPVSPQAGQARPANRINQERSCPHPSTTSSVPSTRPSAASRNCSTRSSPTTGR